VTSVVKKVELGHYRAPVFDPLKSRQKSLKFALAQAFNLPLGGPSFYPDPKRSGCQNPHDANVVRHV
jgi:hypothetical protein